MSYPRPISEAQIVGWAQRLVAQLDQDREDARTFSGLIVEPAIASGTVELDLAKGTTFVVDLTENLTTMDVIEPRATDEQSFEFLLLLKQDGTGGRTVSFPAGWVWPGGSVPTVTATANAEDLFKVTVIDRTFYATTRGQDFS